MRIELNRSGRGIPVESLAGFAFTTNQFLATLGQDLGLDLDSGRWVAYQFGQTSLRFTAEFIGPVEPRQVEALLAAFHGATLLRLATVANMADLGDSIHEDELIGFGLYRGDMDEDPSEWLCLTRWRAMRVREGLEDRLARESEVQMVLPEQLLDATAGRDLFTRRSGASTLDVPPVELKSLADELSTRVTKVQDELSTRVTKVQDELTTRVAKVETDVAGHGKEIGTLQQKISNVEQNLKKMLGTVDQFCNAVANRFGLDVSSLISGERATVPVSRWSWRLSPKIWAGTLLMLAVAGVVWLYLSAPAPKPRRPEPAKPVLAPPTPQVKPFTPAPKPVPEPKLDEAPPLEVAKAESIRVTFQAEADSWMVVFQDGEKTESRLLRGGTSASFEATDELRARFGNAGSVSATWNGKPLGPAGKPGQTRILKFTRNNYENLPVKFPIVDE